MFKLFDTYPALYPALNAMTLASVILVQKDIALHPVVLMSIRHAVTLTVILLFSLGALRQRWAGLYRSLIQTDIKMMYMMRAIIVFSVFSLSYCARPHLPRNITGIIGYSEPLFASLYTSILGYQMTFYIMQNLVLGYLGLALLATNTLYTTVDTYISSYYVTLLIAANALCAMTLFLNRRIMEHEKNDPNLYIKTSLANAFLLNVLLVVALLSMYCLAPGFDVINKFKQITLLSQTQHIQLGIFGIATVMHTALYTVSCAKVEPLTYVIINALAPVLIAIASYFVYLESFSKLQLLGMALVFFGSIRTILFNKCHKR